MEYLRKVCLLFILVLLLVHNNQFAQEKFTVGTFIASGYDTSTHYKNYPQVLDLGVNSIFQLAIKNVNAPNLRDQRSNLDLLSQFSTVWAANDSGTGTPYHKMNAEWQNVDWISYFTSAKYMKWEAEGDTLFPETGNVKVGHDFGTRYTDGNISGWRSGNSASNTGRFLISGPNYWQYPRYTFTNVGWNSTPINYIASFNIKLGAPPSTNVPVCSLFVIMTNKDGIEHTLDSSLVMSSQLNSTTYTPIPLNYNYSRWIYTQSTEEKNYTLPGSFFLESDGPGYNLGSTIEFKVQWLGNIELLVDYIEVYDRLIWEIWFKHPLQTMIDSIVVYDQEFAQNSNFYSKLKYYYTMDEPHSVDGYTPLRKVQEILDDPVNNIQADLLTHWYSEGDNIRDGDPSWPPYIALAQPKKVMFWFAPFTNSTDTGIPWDRSHTLYLAHKMMQNAFYADSNFYVSAQTFGSKLGNAYIQWMLPDTSEISAETMLTLAHGCKGIFYEGYYTYGAITEQHAEGLVDYPIGDYYPPRDIWYKVKDLTSRLNRELGDNLMKLNYTGEFLMLRKNVWENGFSGEFYDDYLKLNSENVTCNFHAGFFTKDGFDDNDYYYFLLTNQLTTNPINVNVTVKPKTSGFTNYRFRNIEPEYNFDITFKDSTTQTLNNFPAGEGYLFQVAPVVKYGGKLVYSEDVGDDMVLLDDMTIESGATLTVYGNYYAKANITVRNGGKIENYENGKIIFDPGKMLIIEGNAEIKGTSANNKLALQFSGNNTSVLIKPGSSLTMDYCNITGAYHGIVTETGSRSYVNITNSNISATYCGISLVSGSSSEDLTSQIYKCNLSSTLYGISASNYNLILIKENTLTGCSINISNSSSAFLQGNIITGSGSATTYGIFMSSSTGFVRSNTITNCLNGLHLANSSPDVGGNILQGNVRHGLYIGSGSIPNLVGYLQINPPLYFPLSGYNKIYSNGSATSTNPIDNDGSEIYLGSSNILLNNGCNQISDDRLTTPSMNTQYIISGSLNNGGRTLSAIYNYWGTRTIAANRFKNLTVTYSPYYTENCPLPDGGSSGGGSETLVLRTSTGLVVDTLVAAEGVPENYTNLQVVYSEADNLFATGNVTQAKPLYEQIVTGNYTSEEQLFAYNKLYAIGNLIGEDETYFSSLQNTFEDIANNEADTLIKKVYVQNAIKCDVSKEEYITAINKFDNIIQQNPNSEEAVYAEIDILTTALNLDTTNTQLGKMGGGKYLVKGTSDYLSKLNNILQSKFGINSEEKEQIIPKEYSLHQNYPNPFNPATTIKYDLPKDGLVTLEVYDIIGRRIAILVNENRNAGSYEQSFNASSLASGVYIYKIQAGEFVSSKKMILLK